MKISVLKDALKLAKASKTTVFIWGKHGLGKSSIVEQVCAENKWGYVNMRCSQMEASDIRGLPDRRDGRTVFLPPIDMPIADLDWEGYRKLVYPDNPKDPLYWNGSDTDALAHKRRAFSYQNMNRLREGILFLDEVNRAADDVLQALFELVLDRKVGQYVLPDTWGIVCAGNFMEGQYIVNGFTDAAFLNRFAHLTLDAGETTLDEWVDYISSKHRESALSVIEFATQNVDHLDGKTEGSNNFSIQPSRRSWEQVIKIEDVFRCGKFMDTSKQELIAGLVGREMATSYSKYSCPVKPRMLIERGVKAMNSQLNSLQRHQMCGLMYGLISIVRDKVDTDEKSATVALDFTEWLCKHNPEKDLAVAFMRALLVKGDNANDHVRVAAISNPHIANLLSKIKCKDSSKSFLDRLSERPALQQLLSETSYGKDDTEEAKK